MREHMGIFRGKRIDNGEWVEGALILWRDGDAEICVSSAECAGEMRKISVDPDTIGECTGLKDKNDNLIFEGDLLRFGGIGYVVYGNGCFSVQHIDSINRPAIDIVMLRGVVEIMGNIHDNPELLKGGEN